VGSSDPFFNPKPIFLESFPNDFAAVPLQLKEIEYGKWEFLNVSSETFFFL